jgi:hypothetical protein
MQNDESMTSVSTERLWLIYGGAMISASHGDDGRIIECPPDGQSGSSEDVTFGKQPNLKKLDYHDQ